MGVAIEAFLTAMRRWPSGVTVVTTRLGERVHGMTVSSFASVSLDPPLVLVCADRESDTRAGIAESGVFTVNVLAVDQEALSRRFAETGNEARRFEGIAWRPGATGAPVLEGAAASLDCRVEAVHEAGDHVIYVGRVEAARAGDRPPLLYHAGRYRTLAGEAGDGRRESRESRESREAGASRSGGERG